MAETRLVKLIRLLQQRTNDQKIFWEQTVEENTYQVAFPNYILQIGYRMKSENPFTDEIDYFIRILDENNKIIEEATDDDLKPELGNAYQIMDNLHRSARRQAMGVDKAIDSILSDLENKT
jgi:hypothetical protein